MLNCWETLIVLGQGGLCLLWLPLRELNSCFRIVSKHSGKPCCYKRGPDSPLLLMFDCFGLVVMSWSAQYLAVHQDGVQKRWSVEAHFCLGHMPELTSLQATQSSPYLFNNPMKELWVPKWKDATVEGLRVFTIEAIFFSQCACTEPITCSMLILEANRMFASKYVARCLVPFIKVNGWVGESLMHSKIQFYPLC